MRKCCPMYVLVLIVAYLDALQPTPIYEEGLAIRLYGTDSGYFEALTAPIDLIGLFQSIRNWLRRYLGLPTVHPGYGVAAEQIFR